MKLTESTLRKFIRTLLLKEAEKPSTQYITKPATRNPKYVDVFISVNGKERLLGTFVSDEKAALAIKKHKLEKKGAAIDRSIKKQPTGIEESHIDPVSDPRFSKIAVNIFKSEYHPRANRNTLMSKFNFNGDDDMKLLAKTVNAPIGVVTADYEDAIELAKKKLGINEGKKLNLATGTDTKAYKSLDKFIPHVGKTLKGDEMSYTVTQIVSNEVVKLESEDGDEFVFVKGVGMWNVNNKTLMQWVPTEYKRYL